MYTYTVRAFAVSFVLSLGCGASQGGAATRDTFSGSADARPVVAQATLMSAPGAGVSGTLTLTETAGAVRIELVAAGLEAGMHGFHFHEVGDCSAQDFTSAGGHFNPRGHQHGAPAATSHAGDLGNVTAAADGSATHQVTSTQVTLADGVPHSVIGKAVILHAKADDLQSQPSGAAGARVACGVISLK